MKTYAELLEDAGRLIGQDDAAKKVADLLKDNHKYRSTINTMNEDADQAKKDHLEAIAEIESSNKASLDEVKAQLPSDGTVAVSQDDYELLGKVKEIHTEDNDIFEVVGTVNTLQASNQELRNNLVLGNAADKLGFKRDPLATLLKTVDGTVSQKDDDYVFVDPEGKESQLQTFIEEQFDSFLPSLKRGTRYPSLDLSGGASTEGGNVVDKFLEKKNPNLNTGD